MKQNRYGMCVLTLLVGLSPTGVGQGAGSGTGGGLAFLPNGGQWPDAVRSQVQAGPLTAWFEADGWIVSSWDPYPAIDDEPSQVGVTTAVRLRFLGVDPEAPLVGEQRLAGSHNDLRGDDPSRWLSGLPMHAAQRWVEPYDGIDVVTFGDEGRLRYDLHVRPGARLADVAVAAEGALGLSLDDDGTLLIETEAGVIRQAAPVTWNELPDGTRWPVDASFRLLGDGLYGFEAPDADPDAPLVVDPTLEWGTYLGGGNIDYVFDSALAPDGSLVTAGFTTSSDYPTTLGSYEESLVGSRDVFITRLDPTGSTIDFSTLLGGHGSDEARAVDVADDGRILVGGLTTSSDFPAINANHGTSFGGGGGFYNSDGFVALLDPQGQQLLMSAYVGGSHDEFITGLAFGPNGPCFTGFTQSSDLAVTPGALGGSHGGGTYDGFVGALDSTGTDVLFLTYLGGNASDVMNCVMVEADGRVTAAGWSSSADYPITAGALQGTSGGLSDAVVTTFDAGGALLYSTRHGGSWHDNAYWVERDEAGRLMVGGTTSSTDFPVTPGAPSPTFAGGGPYGGNDGFVTVLEPDGGSLAFSTYFGGSNDDGVIRLTSLGGGLVAALGHTMSSDVPVTADALDAQLDGNQDVALGLFDTVSSELTYATYVGGAESDKAWDMQVRDGSVLIAGHTTSDDLPVTAGAWDQVFDGAAPWVSDGWAMRIDLGLPSLADGTFTDLGFAVSGTDGMPSMENDGSLAPLVGGALNLASALPLANGLMVMSADAGYYPTHGGVLVPYPVAVTVPFQTTSDGRISFTYMNHGTIPSGATIYGQAWVMDPAGPKGWSASNAVEGIIP